MLDRYWTRRLQRGVRRVSRRKASNTIVSLTTTPVRISHAWIAIESVLQGTVTPSRVVLVLSREEFGDGSVPASILDQTSRGLEIRWVDDNTRSYKKLLPVLADHRDVPIVTIDDDAAYRPWMLEGLLRRRKVNPRAVIGYRGREIQRVDGTMTSYRSWPLAPRAVSAGEVILTGVGGILYPPDADLAEQLLDQTSALRAAPHADDVWFWGATVSSGLSVVCLNRPSFRSLHAAATGPSIYRQSVLAGTGDRQDKQIRAVSEHFEIGV